jgi:hypothetical protein
MWVNRIGKRVLCTVPVYLLWINSWLKNIRKRIWIPERLHPWISNWRHISSASPLSFNSNLIKRAVIEVWSKNDLCLRDVDWSKSVFNYNIKQTMRSNNAYLDTWIHVHVIRFSIRTIIKYLLLKENHHCCFSYEECLKMNAS